MPGTLFCEKERAWLIDAVKNHADQKTLVSTIADKKIKKRRLELWTELRAAFMKSAVAEHPWSVEQLTVWWKNTKKKGKAQSAKHKAAVRQTGGGPPPKSLPAEVDEVMELMGDTTKPLDNPNDSDASFFNKEEVVPADKWSIGKTKEDDDPVIFAGEKISVPKHKKQTNGPVDMRAKEHELIVRKLTLEIEVLQKKAKYLDQKMSRSAGGRGYNDFMTGIPVTPASHSGFMPRELFSTPSHTAVNGNDFSAGGITGFNYSDGGN